MIVHSDTTAWMFNRGAGRQQLVFASKRAQLWT